VQGGQQGKHRQGKVQHLIYVRALNRILQEEKKKSKRNTLKGVKKKELEKRKRKIKKQGRSLCAPDASEDGD
jgi:hypothetical protein